MESWGERRRPAIVRRVERPFWEEKWALGQTNFHEGAPNALLVRHAARLEGRERVYVPLCGKTRDLAFLRDRGHTVFGTEIVPQAVAQLFDEHGATASVDDVAPFRRHAADRLTVLEGDAFALDPSHLGGPVDAIFDRAALVAVAPETRIAYVTSLTRVLRPGGVALLVAFDYDQNKVSGPPWAVSPSVVSSLFGADYDAELLEEHTAAPSPKFKAEGVDVIERLYALTKRG